MLGGALYTCISFCSCAFIASSFSFSYFWINSASNTASSLGDTNVKKFLKAGSGCIGGGLHFIHVSSNVGSQSHGSTTGISFFVSVNDNIYCNGNDVVRSSWSSGMDIGVGAHDNDIDFGEDNRLGRGLSKTVGLGVAAMGMEFVIDLTAFVRTGENVNFLGDIWVLPFDTCNGDEGDCIMKLHPKREHTIYNNVILDAT